MKSCPKCKIRKTDSSFHKNRSKPDGLQTTCKACDSISYGKILKCEKCQKEFEINHRNVRRRKTFLCPQCLFQMRQSELIKRNKECADYRTVSTRGYQYLFCHERKKYIFEHRMVIEKEIGRRLTKLDVVHHIDHNPLNNKADNLVLTDMTGHRNIHKSLEQAAWEALKRGSIIYNRHKGIYEAK